MANILDPKLSEETLKNIINQSILAFSDKSFDHGIIIFRNASIVELQNLAGKLEDRIDNMGPEETLSYAERTYKIGKFPYIPVIFTSNGEKSYEELLRSLEKLRKINDKIIFVVLDEKNRLREVYHEKVYNVDIGYFLQNS